MVATLPVTGISMFSPSQPPSMLITTSRLWFGSGVALASFEASGEVPLLIAPRASAPAPAAPTRRKLRRDSFTRFPLLIAVS